MTAYHSSREVIHAIRGPILNPRPRGGVQFIPDGLLMSDWRGRIEYVGRFDELSHRIDPSRVQRSAGIICPPFVDCHIHIPQHPIRGRFMEGIGPNLPEGRLIAGLNRNVFPAEGRCADAEYTRQVVREFLDETLSQGVIGGAAYMTVHPAAARIALQTLPPTWFVGPVLMNMNCPDYLRTDQATIEREIDTLARDFGQRVIVTDRFAVSVDSELRRTGVALARKLDLRMQTHLAEQIKEKRLVEEVLYPAAGSYTDVYARDGLLDCRPIMAHCIWLDDRELELLRSKGAVVAHCPTSNSLLGSGVMPLDQVMTHDLDWALCTDVGASPTTSLLCEMSQFLKVHAGRSRGATPQEALYRITLAPSRILGLAGSIGSLDVGKAMTFVEIDAGNVNLSGISCDDLILRSVIDGAVSEDLASAIDALQRGELDAGPLLDLLERDVRKTIQRLSGKVRRVVVDRAVVWQRHS